MVKYLINRETKAHLEYAGEPELDVISRLKSAHQAANDLPDIIAELRDTLGPELMGMLCAQESTAGNCAEPDMTDWRNWREGDLVTAVNGAVNQFTAGRNYILREINNTHDYVGVKLDDTGTKNWWLPSNFRFHSRPKT